MNREVEEDVIFVPYVKPTPPVVNLIDESEEHDPVEQKKFRTSSPIEKRTNNQNLSVFHQEQYFGLFGVEFPHPPNSINQGSTQYHEHSMDSGFSRWSNAENSHRLQNNHHQKYRERVTAPLPRCGGTSAFEQDTSFFTSGKNVKPMAKGFSEDEDVFEIKEFVQASDATSSSSVKTETSTLEYKLNLALTQSQLQLLVDESSKPFGFIRRLSSEFGVSISTSKESQTVSLQNGTEDSRSLVKYNIMKWVLCKGTNTEFNNILLQYETPFPNPCENHRVYYNRPCVPSWTSQSQKQQNWDRPVQLGPKKKSKGPSKKNGNKKHRQQKVEQGKHRNSGTNYNMQPGRARKRQRPPSPGNAERYYKQYYEAIRQVGNGQNNSVRIPQIPQFTPRSKSPTALVSRVGDSIAFGRDAFGNLPSTFSRKSGQNHQSKNRKLENVKLEKNRTHENDVSELDRVRRNVFNFLE